MRWTLLILLAACGNGDGDKQMKGPSGKTTPSTWTSSTPCTSTWFLDEDGDGFGGGEPVTACEAPAEHVAVDGDCDDSRSEVHPDASEVCGGLDDDCDGLVDDADDSLESDLLAYTDTDLDGHGGSPRPACVMADGEVAAGGDCDDGDASIHPGADDAPCDGIESDCDPATGPLELFVPSAHPTIQDAIEAAQDGSHVCVAPGTYTELLTFSGATEDLVVMGAGPHQTIIDAADQETAVLFAPRRGNRLTHTTLQGLTVQNGHATPATERKGGGIYVGDGHEVALHDMVIASSQATDGGGMAVAWGGDASLTDTVLRDNVAVRDGGGLLYEGGGSLRMTRVEVVDNEASDDKQGTGGGAMLRNGNHIIEDSTFVGNISRRGGGLRSSGRTTTVSRSVFTENIGYLDGAAMAFFGTAELHNVEVTANGDPKDWGVWHSGSAVFADGHVSATNLIVAGNTSYGIRVSSFNTDASLELVNATIVGNGTIGVDVSQSFGTTQLSVTNSIISSNGFGGAATEGFVQATFAYTNVWGHDSGYDFLYGLTSPTGVDGNVSLNPQFRTFTPRGDPTVWDLTLSSASPMVDAGDPGLSDPDGSRSDLGAYGGPSGDDW